MLLTKLLVVGVLAGTGAGSVLGQSSSVPFDWASLVGGAVGSSPAAVVLAWRLSKADKEAVALRIELGACHQQTLLMVERMAPVLGEATRTLAEVKSGMEATMDPELTSVLRRLETVAEEINRDRRGNR